MRCRTVMRRLRSSMFWTESAGVKKESTGRSRLAKSPRVVATPTTIEVHRLRHRLQRVELAALVIRCHQLFVIVVRAGGIAAIQCPGGVDGVLVGLDVVVRVRLVERDLAVTDDEHPVHESVSASTDLGVDAVDDSAIDVCRLERRRGPLLCGRCVLRLRGERGEGQTAPKLCRSHDLRVGTLDARRHLRRVATWRWPPASTTSRSILPPSPSKLTAMLPPRR